MECIEIWKYSYVFFAQISITNAHAMVISTMERRVTESGTAVYTFVNDPDPEKGRRTFAPSLLRESRLRMFEIKGYNPIPLFFMNLKLR